MSDTKRKSTHTSRSIIRLRNERKKRNNSIILFGIVSLFVGYYILEYVAVLKEPPLGATFNIILGCVIIAVSVLVIIFTIRKQYFAKKRRRTAQHVFLDDDYLQNSKTQATQPSNTETNPD